MNPTHEDGFPVVTDHRPQLAEYDAKLAAVKEYL
jgi:hypothetical protein